MQNKHTMTPIRSNKNIQSEIQIVWDIIKDHLEQSVGQCVKQRLHILSQLVQNNNCRNNCNCAELEKNISEMYNQLVTKDQIIEKMKKSLQKRLETIQILLYQKDYDEALDKVNYYKKNTQFQLEQGTTDPTLKSINDSINKAFYQSQTKSEITSNLHLQKLKRIIQDDQISITIKEQIFFNYNFEQQCKQQLHHVTLEEVLQAKKKIDKATTIQLFDIQQQILISNKKQDQFQKRILLQNMRQITDDSPILCTKQQRQKSQKKYPQNVIKLNKIETGKKKAAIINISDVSGMNLFSEIHSCQTGRKLGKRQRSLTSRKGESYKEQKGIKIQQKQTQKKKLKKVLTVSSKCK